MQQMATTTLADLTWPERIVANRLGRQFQDEPESALFPLRQAIPIAVKSLGLAPDAFNVSWSEEEVRSHFRVIGVLNPRLFTDVFKLELGVYFIDVGDQLMTFWEAAPSYPAVRDLYQVFGRFDVVMTSLGSPTELQELEGKLTRSGFDFLRLKASEVIKYRGYTHVLSPAASAIATDQSQAANAIAADYLRSSDRTDLKTFITRFKHSGMLLGPAVLEDVRWTGRARAWVAIRFGSSVSSEEKAAFIKRVMESPEVQPNLTNLFMLDPNRSSNFSCLAELTCDTFGDLDMATDQIIWSSERLETLTLPVAKSEERPWLITRPETDQENASSIGPLSPGLGQIWLRLNDQQQRSLLDGKPSRSLVALFEDTLNAIYNQDGPEQSPVIRKEIDSLATRFVRAVLDGDPNAIGAVHGEAAILMEKLVRDTATTLGQRTSGSLELLEAELEVIPEGPRGWGHYEALIDRWVETSTEISDDDKERWRTVAEALADLRVSRNRRFHGLAKSRRAVLDRIAFEVAKFLEDAADASRWLESLSRTVTETGAASRKKDS